MSQGERLVGLIVKIPSPAMIEAAGHAGLDLIVLDTEHGAADTADLEHHLRAADSADIPVIVRVGANNALDILRALDAGATGVVVPHVDDADQAESATAAAYYPPFGTRGLATSTRAGYQSTGTLRAHIARAHRETVVFAQIEDRTAIPHARRIASTPRLDAVWLGPTDLSMSLGHPGDLRHPDVDRAISSVVDAVNEAATARLCVIVDSEDDVDTWSRRGASIFLYSAHKLLADRFAALAQHSVLFSSATECR
jgi:4-hydroxy-2-oxoheptanedioate aldolase